MLRYIDVIPARESIEGHESLNILGGVANDGDAVSVDISVWGRVDRAWKRLMTRRFDIAAHEHKHLYFTLEPDCFSPARWGEEIEDIELLISDRAPDDRTHGKIVFIDGGTP